MDTARYSDELDRDLLLSECCVGWSDCFVSIDQARTTVFMIYVMKLLIHYHYSEFTPKARTTAEIMYVMMFRTE